MDSSSILEDYSQSLSDLTFNSRPIIDNLTIIAQENPGVADGIIDVITKRIYKCIPEHKLFALFLLDSVCKYAGNSYNILVGEDIFLLFSHVFQYSNEHIRKTKLLALFETWKVTKTKGTNFPLFPKEQLDKIENFLNKAGYLRPKSITPIPVANSTSVKGGALTNNLLISDIDKLLPIFQGKISSNSDPKLQDRLKALVQLRTLLKNQTMTPNDLVAVQTQLNSIKEQELGGAAITPSTSTPAPSHNPNHYGPANSNATPIFTPAATTASSTPAATPISTPGSVHNALVQEVPGKAENLFQILIDSGLVNVEQAPIPGSKPVYNLVYPKAKFIPSTNQIPSNSTLQDILNSNVSSSIHRLEFFKLKFQKLMVVSKQIAVGFQDFLNTNNPSHDSLELLYEAKASKCSICGKRFANDVEGSTRKRLHLDWHFRINKKLANSTSKVQSRNWYLDEYDWANFKDDELLEFSTNDSAANKNSDTSNKEELELAEYGKLFVQVPPSDTNMSNRCLICHEYIKATYNDELGEWCWFNSIRQPGEGSNSRKIIHIACFHEANRKRVNDGDLQLKVKRERV